MKIILSGLLLCFSLTAFGQKSDKLPRYFGDPVLSDSASAVMIPVRYHADLLSSNKLALWHDFYSNIIFYDFTTDISKKLFADDTYIKAFTNAPNSLDRYSRQVKRFDNMSSNWIFYFVKPSDHNSNGRIDHEDPSVIYVSDRVGDRLKALTPESENAVSIEIFDKQGFALVKMQRDTDNNKRFESKDKSFYYLRLDLKTLAFGKKIESI